MINHAQDAKPEQLGVYSQLPQLPVQGSGKNVVFYPERWDDTSWF